jgi:hypothetical protein
MTGYAFSISLLNHNSILQRNLGTGKKITNDCRNLGTGKKLVLDLIIPGIHSHPLMTGYAFSISLLNHNSILQTKGTNLGTGKKIIKSGQKRIPKCP